MVSFITFRSSKSCTYSIDLPALTDRVCDFSTEVLDICHESIALVESVKKNDKLVKNIPEVCDALSEVKRFVDNAYEYINKLEDVPFTFKTTDGSNQSAKQRCITMLQKAQNSLKESCVLYETLKISSKNAQRICDAATAKLSQEAKNANRKKVAARVTGGVLAVAGVGTGLGVSIVAGVLTLGVGTVVGLATTASLATATGVGGGVVSHFVAEHYSECAENFEKLSRNFSRLSDHAIALSELSSEMTTALDNIIVNLTREKSKELMVDLQTNGERACIRIAFKKSQVCEMKTSLESAVALLMREQ